jgi:hypothetical protein
LDAVVHLFVVHHVGLEINNGAFEKTIGQQVARPDVGRTADIDGAVRGVSVGREREGYKLWYSAIKNLPILTNLYIYGASFHFDCIIITPCTKRSCYSKQKVQGKVKYH